MLGKTVGSYEVTQKLGEGGMGAVYLAKHTLLGRKAAVKVLLPEFSQNQAIVSRFFNEAKAATAIDHPGIIDVFDFGYDDEGQAYLAMDFLDGDTLSERLKKDGLHAPERVVMIGKQIAGALEAAHDCGIVHRDLKPDNVMLVPDPDVLGGERVKILDFGIAKLSDTGGPASMHKTRTGSVMGTPTYMAPEQCRGLSSIDHRADIYSLGCLLYELACGRPPFLGEGTGDLIVAHISQAPRSPRSFVRTIPPSLEALILRLLSKDPADRPQTMAEVGAALEGVLFDEIGSLPTLSGIEEVPHRAAITQGTSPTTLSAASGPPTRAQASKSRGIAMGALLLVLLGGGAAVLLASSEPGESKGTPMGASEAIASSASFDARREASEESREIRLEITSTPTQAEVFRAFDGVRLGITPFTQSLPASDGVLQLVLRSAGFEDHPLTLAADKDFTADVAMTLLPSAPAGSQSPDKPRASGKAPGGKEKTEPQKVEPLRTPPDPQHRTPIRDGTINPF